MSQMVDDPFAAVVGQDRAVEVLRRSAEAPVHAYLFVGETGWGTRAAARAFAGELLAGADDPRQAARHRRLAAEERHPALFVVERSGASISVAQTEEIVRQASMSPPEGTRQVIVIVDIHLVGTRAPMLLKTIEEPPPGTFFVVLTDEVTPELATIASRCVRVDFGPIPTDVVIDALTAEGVAPETAQQAARSCGGDLDRARLLAADPGLQARQRFWWELPSRLDGSGARVVELVAEIEERVAEVLAPLQAQHDTELAALADRIEQMGGTKGELREVEARHKREARRVRTDELRAGLATIADRYRREIGGPDGTRRHLEAGLAIQQLADRLVFNVNERLALEALLLELPPVEAV
jgi:DNA polymerase-3 subunit delta'